jgi:quercetin dioxygenase-like cupin family protein
MVKSLSRLVLLIAISLVVAGTATAQDPLKVGPKIYRKLLENERVRMLEVAFAPGDSIGMHSHPDHAVYAVTGGKLRVTTSDGKTQVADLKAGDPIWFPAVIHGAKNIGATPLKLVVVELKEKPMMK